MSADGRLTISVIDQWDGFLAMGDAWNRLLESSPQAKNVFLTHEWFRAWWEAFGDGKRMLILVVKSGDRLIGIAPLMLFRTRYYGAPIRLLSLIANDHTNRCDLIVTERARECVHAVVDFVREMSSRWDMIELDFVPEESPTVPAVSERAQQVGLVAGTKPSYRSPFIPLRGTWEEFYGRLDGRFRRNMRNREKRLAALGEVAYEQEPVSLSGFLEEMFVVGELSWKGAEQTAIGSTPELRRFYSRLAELTHPKGWLSVHLLRVSGRPIAFHYSLRSNGAVCLLKTEFDTSYNAYSPGHQIQKRVLQACYANGVQEFDFLGPNMTWKQEWSDQVRGHVRLLLFHGGPRSRGLAFLELRAKPVLKESKGIRWLRYTLPQVLRHRRRKHAAEE